MIKSKLTLNMIKNGLLTQETNAEAINVGSRILVNQILKPRAVMTQGFSPGYNDPTPPPQLSQKTKAKYNQKIFLHVAIQCPAIY